MGRCYNPYTMKEGLYPEENYFYSQLMKSKLWTGTWLMTWDIPANR